MKILTTATKQMDRIKGLPIVDEKDLKKQGTGSSCYIVDLNSGVTVLRWFDNKCVQIATTYTDCTDMQTIHIQKHCVISPTIYSTNDTHCS